MVIICCPLFSIENGTERTIMRVARSIGAAATMLGLLSSVGVAQIARGAAGAKAAAAQVTVPSVIDSSLSAARAVMSDAGFACNATNIAGVVSSPSDIVMRQIPAPKRLMPIRTPCMLYVKSAPVPPVPEVIARFPMPELTGLPVAEAQALADKARLVIISLQTADAEGRPDTVIDQTPRVGTMVSEGDSVILIKGRPISLVAQNPSAGERVPPGSSVTVDTAVPAPKPPQIVRLTIVPDGISIAAGDTVRMTALAQMSDGSQTQVAATWTASTGNITSNGVFVADASMTRVTVTASQNGQSATAVIRVSAPPPPPAPLPPPPPPHWPLALLAAALATLGAIGGVVWKRLHRPDPPPRPPPLPPPPLAFTYDCQFVEIETDLSAPAGHGPELALVSHTGESEHAIEPHGVKLIDEENSHG